MNLYFVHADGRVVTPELGTILEGITRGSIIELLREMGRKVEERSSPSTSGATAWPAATSSRSSPAAPPPWSRRSAR